MQAGDPCYILTEQFSTSHAPHVQFEGWMSNIQKEPAALRQVLWQAPMLLLSTVCANLQLQGVTALPAVSVQLLYVKRLAINWMVAAQCANLTGQSSVDSVTQI